MPSLFRLLVICLILAGIGFGAMVWLSNVPPVEREMVVKVKSNVVDELNAKRLPKPEAKANKKTQ